MSTPQEYASTVNSFYLAFYGRPAEPAGLKFWSEQLANNNGDYAPIIQQFAASQETQVRFASESVADRIAEIYDQLFHRAPDAEGLAFYTRAIEQGQATLADVSVAILRGAQDSDKTLSDLRQQAADDFTAQVEASGSSYGGYAAIEAARVLVRAVTLDTKPADMAALVKAAVAFSDVATTTPAVVGAIASGGPLLAMFDTARGLAEPVALLQSLADTAKAAAGNPDTLESLLRGGGMTKVLEVMPAKATLQDVVDALGKGGLPAAVEVVYPSKPATPSEPAMRLSFDSVAPGEGDTVRDHVTKLEVADVTFTYTGKDLNATQHFEYSLDGTNWSSKGVVANAATNTVVIEKLDLSKGKPTGDIIEQGSSHGPSIMPFQSSTSHVDLATQVWLRAVGANDRVVASASQEVIYDSYVAAPTLSLVADTKGKNTGSAHDNITNKGGVVVGGIEAGAKVEYMAIVAQEQETLPPVVIPPIVIPTLPTIPTLPFIPMLPIIPTPVIPTSSQLVASIHSETTFSTLQTSGNSGNWVTAMPTAKEGLNTIVVRQTDAAGNVNQRQISFTLDTKAPDAPQLSPLSDSEVASNVSVAGKFKVTGLEAKDGTIWEYSTDNGVSWELGQPKNSNGGATLDLSGLDDGNHQVQVRQVDAAGNIGQATLPLAFTLDQHAPTATLSFSSVNGATGSGSNVTPLNNTDVFFALDTALAAGEFAEWRIKGSDAQWIKVESSAFEKHGSITVVPLRGINLENSDPTIEIRLNDTAGNHSEPVSQLIDGPYNLTVEATPVPGGIYINSSVAGQLWFSDSNGWDRVKTKSAGGDIVVGANEVGVQDTVVSGKIQVGDYMAPGLGDQTGKVFALGTNDEGGDTLVGNYLWGFAGNDKLTGTDGNDILYGGAGADQLFGGQGADLLYGGQGGDLIDLGANDGVTDVVMTAYGDTGSGIAADGPFAGVDVLLNAGFGDILAIGTNFHAAPTFVTSYLANPALDQIAIVRGRYSDGIFTSGNTDGIHQSYVIQWSDGYAPSSLVLRDFGDTAPALKLNAVSGMMTLLEPETLPQEPSNPPVLPPQEPETPPQEPSDPPVLPPQLPYATLSKDFAGVKLDTNVGGQLESTFANGNPTYVETTEGSTVTGPGTFILGAQQAVIKGIIEVGTPDGPYLTDSVVYTLGTNGANGNLSGQNVWGFGGNDIIYGTTGADYLVGGAGRDSILLGNDGVADTVVIGAGDTATGAFSGGSTTLLDRIIGADAGDLFAVGGVFGAAPLIQTSYLTNTLENQVAVVRGSETMGVFTANDAGIDYVIQWTDGTNVNSIIVLQYGNGVATLDIDIADGTMTLATLVGNSNEGVGIPG